MRLKIHGPINKNFIRNLAKARDEGYGMKLGWDELTEELLYETIHSLLHNSR